MSELSESTIIEVSEGDVLVILKYKGKKYAKAYKANDPKVGAKVKAGLEATQRVLQI